MDNAIKNLLRQTNINYAIMGGKAAIHKIKPIININNSKNYDLYVFQKNVYKLSNNLDKLFRKRNIKYTTNSTYLITKNNYHNVKKFILLNNRGRLLSNIVNIHVSKKPIHAQTNNNGLKYISTNQLINNLSYAISQNNSHLQRKKRLQALKAIRTMKKFINPKIN